MAFARSIMQRRGSILQREGSAQTGTLFLPQVRALPPAPAAFFTTPPEGRDRAHQTERTLLAKASQNEEFPFSFWRSIPCSSRRVSQKITFTNTSEMT
jgi:hypothetical protein